jgi:hypothetical protein
VKTTNIDQHAPAGNTRSIDFVIGYIDDLDGIFAGSNPGYRRSRRGSDRPGLTHPSNVFRIAVPSHEMETLAIKRCQATVGSAAQSQCFLEHCLEYWGEVAGRGVDDLQDLGGRGLPLQRLVTLGSAIGKLTLQIGYQLLGMG